jgi:hypothetical protein
MLSHSIVLIYIRVCFNVSLFLSDFFYVCETVYKVFGDHTLNGNSGELSTG